jgi:hypothetical protein
VILVRSLKTSAAFFCIVLLLLAPLPASANPYTLWDGGNCCWYAWEMAKENWGVYLPWVGDARNWTNLDGTVVSKGGRVYRIEAVDEPSAGSIMVFQPKTLVMLNGNKPYPNDIYGHVAWVDSVSSLKIFADSTTYFLPGWKVIHVRESSIWPPEGWDIWHGCAYRRQIYLWPPWGMDGMKFLRLTPVEVNGGLGAAGVNY